VWCGFVGHASITLIRKNVKWSLLLQVPHTNLRFGSRSFRVSALTIWNSLPHSVRSCESLTTFWKHLKTLIFNLHFLLPPPSDPLPSASDSTSWFWRFINLLTYLLTYLVVSVPSRIILFMSSQISKLYLFYCLKLFVCRLMMPDCALIKW